VCAEFPDEQEDLELFEIISNHMINGSCTHDRCLDDMGRCTKHFLKTFQDHTTMDMDGYPLFSCQDDGCSFEKTVHFLIIAMWCLTTQI
jgi:hypothetical protein